MCSSLANAPESCHSVNSYQAFPSKESPLLPQEACSMYLELVLPGHSKNTQHCTAPSVLLNTLPWSPWPLLQLQTSPSPPAARGTVTEGDVCISSHKHFILRTICQSRVSVPLKFSDYLYSHQHEADRIPSPMLSPHRPYQ